MIGARYDIIMNKMKKLLYQIAKVFFATFMGYLAYQGLNVLAIKSDPSLLKSPSDYWVPMEGFLIVFCLFSGYYIYRYFKDKN